MTASTLVKYGAASGTTGGQGGVTVPITSLADSGGGTIRAFLEDDANDGPRIANLQISGVCALRSDIAVEPFCTLDTIENDTHWIALRNYRIRVEGNEVILRGIAVLTGDTSSARIADNRDGFSVGNQPNVIRNVIIDKCLVAFGSDEEMAIWGPNENITVSNCVFTSPLNDSIHTKGTHGMVFLVGKAEDEPRRPKGIGIYGNILMHGKSRHPLIKDSSAEVEFINNLIHNPLNEGITFSSNVIANIERNVFQRGPSSSNDPAKWFGNGTSTGAALFLSDNMRRVNGNYVPLIPSSNRNVTTTRPFPSGNWPFIAGGQATVDYVLANAGTETPFFSEAQVAAGASPAGNILGRVRLDFEQNVGRIIDTQTQYPDWQTQDTGRGFGYGNNNFVDPDPNSPPDTPTTPTTPTTPNTLRVFLGAAQIAPITVTGLTAGTTWDIALRKINSKGEGPASFPLARGTVLPASGGGTPPTSSGNAPTVFFTETRKNFFYSDFAPVSWPTGHQAGDVLIVMVTMRGNYDATGNSWGTFFSNYDGILLNSNDAVRTGSQVHTGIAYKVATSNNMPAIVTQDPVVTASNVATAVITTIRGGGVPTRRSIHLDKAVSPATLSGGAVTLNSLVLYFLGQGRDSDADTTGVATVDAGVGNLTKRAFSGTTAGSGSQSLLLSGEATATTIGNFSIPLNDLPTGWNLVSVVVPPA